MSPKKSSGMSMSNSSDYKFKKVQIEALKYQTLAEFKAAESAYWDAKWNGWLDEVSKHMVSVRCRK